MPRSLTKISTADLGVKSRARMCGTRSVNIQLLPALVEITSNRVAGSAPARVPSAMASQAEAICTPARSWFTILTLEPMPGRSPRRKTRPATAARAGSAAANACSRARGHDGELAGLRPHRAAGDRRIEERVAGSGQALAECGREGGCHGAVQDHRRVLGRGRQRLGQSRLGLGRGRHHEDKERPSCPASRAEAQACPPPSAKRPSACSFTSKPRTGSPARTRWSAMGSPIAPSPMKPTLLASSAILASRSARRCLLGSCNGKGRAGDPFPRDRAAGAAQPLSTRC